MPNTRRDILVSEMGLGPLWKLRDRAAEAALPDVAKMPPGQASAEQSTRVAPAVRRAPPAMPAQPAVQVDEGRETTILGLDWPALQESVAACVACSLCRTRRNTVFGVGDAAAQWMIIGEAPGAEEDARGEPFVGQAGRLLDNMLASLQMTRDKNVFIANVLKCRPPGNRNPEPSEVAQCSPYLVRQVELIQPKLILAMGRFAAQALLNTDASIASLRGKLHRYKNVPVIVTYHPAYLLRNLPDKLKAWEDLLFARQSIQELTGEGAGAGT
jgi:uracil-DNA glycosylase family 4